MEPENKTKRVVITGIGSVAPNGIGKEAYWKGLKEGKNTVDHITFFDPHSHPSKIAAEIKDFNPADFIDRKNIKRTNRTSHLAVAAALLACEDGKIEKQLYEDMPVFFGSSIGGMDYAEHEFKAFHNGGVVKMSPYTGVAAFCGSVSSEVSIVLGSKAQSLLISSGCVSATDAMGYALYLIRSGVYDIALTGGADACVTPAVVAAFCQMGAISTHYNHIPQKASRPFNKDRDGFVISEGGWAFIFEELSHALARKAVIYAEVVGYGTTCDAYHASTPDPSGVQAVRAMRLAIQDAHLDSAQIDCVVAYGNSTKINDSCETQNIKNALGKRAYEIPVVSIKSMLGHPIGATGAAQLAAAVMAVFEDFVPPTINYENPDSLCDLDYVPNRGRAQKIRTALCNTLSFGGKNSVLLVKKQEE